MAGGEGGGWIAGVSSEAFAPECFASAPCAASAAQFELLKGIETAGMELQVEVEDRVSVELGSEVGALVKVWRMRGTLDVDVGVSAGLTTM